MSTFFLPTCTLSVHVVQAPLTICSLPSIAHHVRQQQCQTTRRVLGFDQPWRVFGCRRHPDDSAVEPPQSMQGVCRTVNILSLPPRERQHTVRQAMDALTKTMEAGQRPPGLLTGRCPLCPPTTTEWVKVGRELQAPGPHAFFVQIESSAANPTTKLYSATPSIGVRAYGGPYVLNTVIYKHSWGHFTCQTRLAGECFWVFDDLQQDGEVIPVHQFDPFYNGDGDGEPHLLLYVRQGLVLNTDDRDGFLAREHSLCQYRQLQVTIFTWQYKRST